MLCSAIVKCKHSLFLFFVLLSPYASQICVRVCIKCKLEFHSTCNQSAHLHGWRRGLSLLRLTVYFWYFAILKQPFVVCSCFIFYASQNVMLNFLRLTCMLKESALGVSAQYLFEGLSEVFVKDGVNDRVEWGVAVADPEEKCKKGIRDNTGLWAHCL